MHGMAAMDLHDWKPCIVASSKFEGQLFADILRNAGVTDVHLLADAGSALAGLRGSRVNLLFLALANEGEALESVRQLRRDKTHTQRKSPVLVISSQLTAAQAERFRHAGANAIIGKPVSTASLVGVTKKVLARPRPFIEGVNYVGPCRRAGIVTAGPAASRRVTDTAKAS